MIERLAGHVESSSHRVQAQARRLVRGRRSFHTFFDNNVYNEVYLGQVWTAIAHEWSDLVPSRTTTSMTPAEANRGRLAPTHSSFLSFLYPPQALAFLKRRILQNPNCPHIITPVRYVSQSRRRMSSSQPASATHRESVLSATHVEQSSVNPIPTEVATRSNGEVSRNNSQMSRTLEGKLPHKHDVAAFDHMWLSYLALVMKQRRESNMVLSLVTYFSASASPTDLTRIREMLAAATPNRKHLTAYHNLMEELANRVLGQKEVSSRGYSLFAIYRWLRQAGDKAVPEQNLLSKMLVILANDNGRTFKILDEVDLIVRDYINIYGGVNAFALGALRKLCVRTLRWPQSLEVINLLASTKSPGVEVMKLALFVCSKHGRPVRAQELLDSMQTGYGLIPDTQCWNLLMRSHVKAGNHEEALQCFDRMKQAGTKPDKFTFACLSDIHALHGDQQKVASIFDSAQAVGVQVDTYMLRSLVLARIKAGDLAGAEHAARLVLKAKQEGHIEGSITKSWNYIISAYAVRRQLSEVSRVFRIMQENDIIPDSRTYGSLLLTMSLVHQAKAALKLLTVTMPQQGVEIFPFHYAFLMLGFNKQQQFNKTVRLFEDMQQNGLRADASCLVQYIRARVAVERAQEQSKPDEELIAEVLNELDQIASISELRKFSWGVDDLHSSSPLDTIFETILYSFSKTTNKATTEYILAQYYARRSVEEETKPIPISILSAVMACRLQQGDYTQVEVKWKECLDQTPPHKHGYATTHIGEQDTQQTPNKLAFSIDQRLLLSKPLYHYLQSLKAETRYDTAHDTVVDLLSQGYHLDNTAWNVYIRLMASSRVAKYIVQAFQDCEENLMPNFPGWAARAWKSSSRLRRSRWEGGFEYMKDVTIGHGAAGERSPTKLMPQFATLDLLLGVYLKIRSADLTESGYGAEEISREIAGEDGSRFMLTSTVLANLAPKTTIALETMPKIEVPLYASRSQRLEIPTDPNTVEEEAVREIDVTSAAQQPPRMKAAILKAQFTDALSVLDM